MTKKKKKTYAEQAFEEWGKLAFVFQNKQFNINAKKAAEILEQHFFGNTWTKRMWEDGAIVASWTQVIGRYADIIEQQNTAKNALLKLYNDQVVKNFELMSGYKFKTFKSFQNKFSLFNKLPLFQNIPQRKYKQRGSERGAKKAAAERDLLQRSKKATIANQIRDLEKNK